MKMKPFLIIQLRPEDETANSEFKAILRTGGLKETDVVRFRAESEDLVLPDLSKYSGIIVGGSPFDITTLEKDKSDIQKNIEAYFNKLLKIVVDNDFPFLGACSGNGLLGNYCGGKISRKYHEDVGGVDVTITKEGLKDDLLVGLPRTFRALVGHKEACETLPPGAVHLASSPTCPIQMFRIKNNVYATQFHPEADANEFILRINIYKYNGYFPPEDAQKLIDAVKKENVTVPQEIIRRFVDKYRK